MSTILTPTIIRESRSSISIQITRSGEVVVKAPRFVPMFVINQFINSKEEWIIKNTKKFQKKKAGPKQYVQGETFWYLGNEHKLNLGDFTEISVTTTFNFPKFLHFRIQKELEAWYKKQAKEIITKRLAYHTVHMKASYKSVMFSDTKSKWGTCGPDNDLQFNWRLVMVPLVVLDYVVIHELAHTTEKNHGEKFWKKVAANTPAYRQHRKWLNNHAHLLTF